MNQEFLESDYVNNWGTVDNIHVIEMTSNNAYGLPFVPKKMQKKLIVEKKIGRGWFL